MTKKTIKGYGGLMYVEIRKVPVRTSADKAIGEVIDVPPIELERFVAAEMIRERVPIRGEEVAFLRKVLGMSMERFAARLGLTAASVLKWERASQKRLARINEFAVIGLVADELALTPVPLSELSTADRPKPLVITWPAGRAKKQAA